VCKIWFSSGCGESGSDPVPYTVHCTTTTVVKSESSAVELSEL
jgi:hypothetical protein